jgi:hypothetical protein
MDSSVEATCPGSGEKLSVEVMFEVSKEGSRKPDMPYVFDQ